MRGHSSRKTPEGPTTRDPKVFLLEYKLLNAVSEQSGVIQLIENITLSLSVSLLSSIVLSWVRDFLFKDHSFSMKNGPSVTLGS